MISETDGGDGQAEEEAEGAEPEESEWESKWTSIEGNTRRRRIRICRMETNNAAKEGKMAG